MDNLAPATGSILTYKSVKLTSLSWYYFPNRQGCKLPLDVHLASFTFKSCKLQLLNAKFAPLNWHSG